MAKWEFVDWFIYWLFETKDFIFEWDEGNSQKNKEKHNLTIAEIEEVFHIGRALPLGVQISPPVSELRLGLIGPVKNGDLIQVAFTLRENKIRVISARPAHRKERENYEETLCQIQERIRKT